MVPERSKMGILLRKKICMVRAMCGVQLKVRKRSTDLVLMLGLNETIDQLAMANSVCWYGHVLRRDNGHDLRREDGHVLWREDGHVLRRDNGHDLRREDGHVLWREDGHVLRRDNGHVLRRSSDFEVEGQRGHGGSRFRKKI